MHVDKGTPEVTKKSLTDQKPFIALLIFVHIVLPFHVPVHRQSGGQFCGQLGRDSKSANSCQLWLSQTNWNWKKKGETAQRIITCIWLLSKAWSKIICTSTNSLFYKAVNRQMFSNITFPWMMESCQNLHKWLQNQALSWISKSLLTNINKMRLMESGYRKKKWNWLFPASGLIGLCL